MKRVLFALGTASIATLLFAGTALAAYHLFGDASIVSPGNASPHAVEMRSLATGAGYGGVDFDVAAGTTFNDINTLSTDYLFTQGSCGGGSPRFQINVVAPSGTKNIFVYIGPPPNYTGCPPNVWINTGNLMAPTNLIDATQVGGAFYEPVALAKTAYGSYLVTGIQLVTDAGWFFPQPGQVARADNTNINGTLYTYDQPANKDECKNGGWQHLTRADGSTFKNQGDCIQYVNTGK